MKIDSHIARSKLSYKNHVSLATWFLFGAFAALMLGPKWLAATLGVFGVYSAFSAFSEYRNIKRLREKTDREMVSIHSHGLESNIEGFHRHREYSLIVSDVEHLYENFSSLVEATRFRLQQPTGRLLMTADDGERPWWHRFFFSAKRYTRFYFSIVWNERIGAVFFYDDFDSEHRACLPRLTMDSRETSLGELNFGDQEQIPEKYLLPRENVLDAVGEYLATGELPNWLSYDIF